MALQVITTDGEDLSKRMISSVCSVVGSMPFGVPKSVSGTGRQQEALATQKQGPCNIMPSDLDG